MQNTTKIKYFRTILWLFFGFALLFLSFFSFASDTIPVSTEPQQHNHQVSAHETDSEPTHAEEKFNAGELIVEHISDAHDWHVAGHFSIPLPVILYSSKGFEVFSSSRFEHGHADFNGYRLVKNQIVAIGTDGMVDEKATAGLYDLSITKNVCALFLSMIIMFLIFVGAARAFARRPGEAPKGLQSLVEPLIILVRDDIAKASIGPKYEKYLPFLLTAFFFIWINNLLGLIPFFPGGANLSGNIAFTLVLALFTFLITSFSANAAYWRHVFAMPGVPVWVLFLLTPIEIIGVFLRPFVLMVRLFANITAGHIIILSFISLIFIFGEMGPVLGFAASPISMIFALFMGTLELLVAFLQAYVFTLLSAIYFGTAVEEHHHEEHAHETAH